ncbi:MAG: MATE family efflux transporter, partial [Oscillospiraceae bacterium]
MNNNTEALGRDPVGKLLFKLAAPAIAAQIINLLYNLVDRMYIGHIPVVGRDALTGVGVCLPLIMIISAFAALVSMGGAPRASIFLGKGEKDNAERVLGNSVTLLVAISVVLTVVFWVFAEDMLLVFGASGNTVQYGVDYMKIYALGTLFVQLTLGLNAFISAQGFAKTSMLTVCIGAVCNIILDPILIFGLDMGVAGAALATIISQAVSMVWILIFLLGKKTTLRISAKNLRLSRRIVLPSIALGLSPFIMQATESLIAVCFNSSLLKYGGDLAVGAMTILTSVMQFSMLPLQGLTQGAQPILSYNFGARNPERVRHTFKLLLIACLTYSTAIWALAQFMPQMFVLIFNDDPQLLAFASHALRVYMAVSLVFGVQIACQQTFVALGNAKCSLFLALLRKIILLIPLIYVLP